MTGVDLENGEEVDIRPRRDGMTSLDAMYRISL